MKFLSFASIILTSLILFGCHKDEESLPHKLPSNPSTPRVTTQDVKNISMTSADFEGSASVYPGKPPITEYGIVYGLSSLNPEYKIKGTNIVNSHFFCSVGELLPGTKYYFKAYATNSLSTKYGMVQSFLTFPSLPSVFTTFVHDFTYNSAVLGGYVWFEGESAVTEYGIYWGMTSSPELNGEKIVLGSGLGSFSTTISDLIPNADYFVKAFAINSKGMKLGNQYKFNTGTKPDLPLILDIENNLYHYITIGTQVWMVENLRTTKLNDNTPIANETTDNWDKLTTPAYCWPENDISYKNDFGAIYNWYAISSNKVCPAGWHVSTDADWKILESYLGGDNNAGNKLREVGPLNWKYPNSDATGESGFNALPFSRTKNDYGFWWSLENDLTNAFGRLLNYNDSWVQKRLVYPKANGRLFVRCVRNN